MKRFEEVKGWIKTGHKFTDVVVRFEGHAQVVVVDVALAFESHVNAVKQVYRRFDIRKDVFTHGTNDTSIPEQWRATSVVVNPGTDESLVLLGNADQLCSRINRRIRLLELEASRQPAAELSPWSNENSETGPRCIRALSEPHCLAETHKVCTKAQTLLQRWDQVVDRSSVQEGSDYNMSAAVQSIRTLQSAGPEHDTETILAMLNSAQSSVQRAQEFVNAELALSGVSLATMWRLVAHGIVDPYLICIGPRNLSTSAVHFLATHDASKPRVELSMVQEQFLSQAGQSKPVQLFPGCRMVAVQGVTDTPRTAFKCGRLSLEVTPKTMRLSASQEEGMLTVEGSELSWKPQVPGSYDSSASLAGASVGMPKSARKLPYTFRVDLAQPDSDGRSKYILAAPSSVEFDEWIQVLRAAACCGQSTPRVSSTGAVHAPDEFEPELESEPDSAVSLHWYLSEIRRRFSDPEHNCAVTCLAVQCLQDGLREMLGQSGNFISLAETAQRARALLLAERQKIKNERNAIRADGVLQRAEEVRPLLNSQTPSFGTLDSLHEQKLAQQDKLDNALLTLKQATRRNKQTDEHRVAVDEAKRQLSGTVRKLTQEMRRLYAHAEMDWPELLHNEKLPDVSERFQGLPGFQGVEVCAAQGWNRSLYSDMRKIADGRNTVYKAVRVDDGREVVLKEVKIDSNLDKLEREVALLVKLRHPNIVQVEACFKDEASLFIQMPLYRGGNLRSWLVFNLEDFRGDKHLRERRRKILADILLAVHRVHSLDGGGSVHNDIKLSNVLLTDGHTSAVLIDFETAQDRSRQRTGVTTTQHHAVGTHAYMAPERLVDSDHPDSAIEGSWSTDMYSVGVVLLLAFSPELIDRVEGGQEIPNKALDEVREQLEHSYGWLPQLLNDPLAGTGLLTDPLLADGSGAETALPMPPDASPLASRRNATESYRASGPSPRRLFPEGRRKRARQILDMEYFKAGATTALPPHWTQQSGSEHGYTLVPLDESDPTVHTLRHMVAETRPDDFGKGLDSGAEWQRAGLQEGNRHSQFVRAWRLENTVLWKQYQARVERTNADLSRGPALDALPAARRSGPIRAALREGGQSLEGGLRPECAECFLMHGCPIDNLGNILANGLDQGFAGTNAGNAFGVGIYFAEDIEKCDQYTRCPAKRLKSAQLEALAPLFQTLYGGDECAEHDDVLFILVCRATMGYSIRTTGYDIPMDGRELGKTAPTQPRDPSCPSPGSKSIFHQPRTRKKLIGVVDPITKDVIQPLLHHHSLIAEKGVRIQRFREFVLFDGSSVYPCVPVLIVQPCHC
jgi:serine/threonine protein kinase